MRTLIKSLMLITVLSLTAYAEIPITTQNLDFSKAWFKPFLAENKDPVCDSLLAASQHEFFSIPTKKYDFRGSTGPIPNDSDWSFLPAPYEQPIIIDGSKVYAHGFHNPGCGGACESEYMTTSKTPFPETDQYIGLSFNENQMTTSVPAYSALTGLYRHKSGFYYLITKDEFTLAYKVKPDATLDKVCVISNKPTQKFEHSITEIQASVTLLAKKTNALLGDEGDCGRRQTLSRWGVRIIENLNMTIYRPWAIYELPDTDSTYDADIKNLETWALQDIPQKLAFDEYTKQLSITTKNLSDFYQKTFKWSKNQSDKIAHTALTAAISSGIRFYMYNQLSQHQKNLLSAITDKKSLTTIKQLSENTKALSKHILNISIKNPEALEFFLTENSNPNEQNEFNKSLLMYAAQYNELESAKILIKNKADLNLSTIIPNDTCTYKLSKFGMTALHYAVRYASYDFVKLLLDNGAYPYAKTSEQDGGYPIDWLKKYTATAAQERNPNITQEQILALEALLKLPTPEEIAKKVLSYNLTAEQEFSKGNIESAYMNCKYALGLDEHNERALANFSLITLKMNKKLESLEASYNLINFGKDINQVANAWFNYGLTCGSGKFSYENYNGVLHCEKLPIYYFLNSFNKKPSSSRANKIVESLKKGETPNCQFKKGNINLLITLSTYGSEKDLYVLTPKSSSLDVSKIVWYNQHETKDANNLITKTRIKKSPEKLVNTYDLGDFTMNIYQSDKAIDTPIEFDGETCNRRLFGAYTVSPSTEK